MLKNSRFNSYAHLTSDDKALVSFLCLGSDERSLLDIEGFNKYGGAPYPRQTIAFGSCTSSTISSRGWEAARSACDKFQSRVQEIGELGAANELGQETQAKLLNLMNLDDIDGLKLVLTPSGTDAESIASYLIAQTSSRSLVNIIVGAREVGSGSALAAGARYFSALAPSGEKREPGNPVDPELAERIRVHQIKVRSDSANERAPDDLDREINQLVEESIAAGADVILHIVAHSKTGVHAPRLETVNQLLLTYGKRIVPIIDAAQGRFSRRGLREYVSRGFMVILTGSKFYGGVPFSGCLLVPKALSPLEPNDLCFPPGFSDYLTPAQLPVDWYKARNSLKQTVNLGLLMRWQVAIAEIAAYYSTPGIARYRILRFFESQVPIILGRCKLLELINVPTPVFDNASERLLESKTTVFSFRIRKSESDKYQLDKAGLDRWVRWMNLDISGAVNSSAPEDIRHAAGTCFQLGQAVHVGEQQSGDHDYVIRVAIGGVLVTQVAIDESLGSNLDERLSWLERTLESLRLKIEFIADNESAILMLFNA